ncbi:MAG: hypothetical protein GVY18_06885, partial [Bacteroidetes bacterium]|nr:hypothetical protein [Bacteroidota bacterium]
MHRRDLFRLGGAALLWTTLSPLAGCRRSSTGAGTERHLFVSPDDLPRVRANAQTTALRPIVEEWAAVTPDAVRAAFDKAVASGNIIRDLRDAIG